MKKNLKISSFLFILMMLSVLVSAQTEKGKSIISGSTNLNFSALTVKFVEDKTSTEIGKTSSFELSPGAGYFVANNLLIGVEISLASAKETVDNDTFNESTTMLFPFARYYFSNTNVKPFLQASVGTGWQKNKNDNDKTRANVTGYEFGGGLAVFLNPNLSLDFSLGYVSATSKFDDEGSDDWKIKTNGVGGSIGFSIFF